MNKIENEITLTFLQRMTLKKGIKKIQRKFKNREKFLSNQQKAKKEMITAIMELSLVLEITDEQNNEVTPETLELRSVNELLDTLDLALAEVKKLI